MKKVISTKNAPAAVGPYSQAIKAGNMLFISGQIPLDPSSGELVSGDVRKAACRSLDNVGAILKEAGASFDNVVKTTVFVKNMEDFSVVNEVYAKYFKGDMPARSCVEVKLPKDALVEVEVIAVLD